ncbi:ABC transporter substrate-binding protein [Telmatospirillum siberiense]|uniref:ABC transporter substrate-binding protein n=1 Tax=Telmatospirillum siberiense TaxID=382514 RepID=A0A2N3PZ09_9PROT|nr:ABC transporter substrate-binding protein [Telmatospirillum siberiense]PKU25652.1 ABC transporter substrate-binding protein [Telmatospirillum siberiense]
MKVTRLGPAVLISALLAASSPAWAGKANDTLVYASDSELVNISQYHNNVREGVIIARLIWDTLLNRDVKTGTYQPQLATSWTWVDPLTIDLDLRQGVTFHDGSSFSADDVVFTFNYVLDPDSKVVTKQNVEWMKSAEKLGDYKVRIHLKKPFPAALEYLAGPLPIYPAAYFKKVGLDGFAKAPIGTGPYRVVTVENGKGVKMVKSPTYWKGSPIGQPTIGKIEFLVIPDGETRLAELMTGGIDWIWRVQADQAKQLADVPNVSVLSAETMRVGFLQFNNTGTSAADQPLHNPLVRQAISYAIDRKTMVDSLVRGGSRVMNSACFIDQFGCTDQGVPHYDYNPEKAKKLLAEAGYPNGFETQIYAYREREYAEAVVGYLRAVGIRANLNYMKYDTVRELSRAGKVPIYFQTWGSFSISDASAFLGAWFKGGDDDLSKDQEVTKLLDVADTSTVPETRKKSYAEALKRIGEQAYVLPMFSYSANYAFTSDLDFTAQPDELPRFYSAHWK